MIKDLPNNYRDIIDASEIQSQKHKDIVEETGLSLPAVKSRVKRGRELLKDKLQACCDFEFKEDGGVESFCRNNCGCGG